jgi:hypothetical protein
VRLVAIAAFVSACSFRAAPGAQPATDASLDASNPDGPPDTPQGTPAPFAMAGARWLLPCTSANLGLFNCDCAAQPIVQQVTLAGNASEHWSVAIRIRGVMEGLTYGNGAPGPSSGWYVGGDTAGDTGDNLYELQISSPPAHYYLNDGTPTTSRSFAFDETATIVVDGNATLTFTANGQDGLQWGNYDASHNPIVISGIAAPTQPYDGQFAVLDVLSATRM